MKGFKKVLLLFRKVPENKLAIKRAGLIAGVNDAELTILYVLENLPSADILDGLLPEVDVTAAILEAVKQKILSRVKALIPSNVEVNIIIKQGTQWYETIKEVMVNQHDLVLTTTEPKNWLQKIIFGSTAMNLVRKCPVPVWVMRPRCTRSIHRIVAAIDPDATDPVRDSLNKKILSVATELAQFENCKLHIVHAWQLPGESTLSGGFVKLPKESLDKMLKEAEQKQRAQFDQLLSHYDLSNINYVVHFLKGDASILIPKFVHKKRINLIVMGTVCRSGVKGFLIGNTAETVLGQVKCSILAMKPDGFITPVELD